MTGQELSWTERSSPAERRDLAAAARDLAAARRDALAEGRDTAGEGRDLAARARDRARGPRDAVAERVAAGADRDIALADRASGAADRSLAVRDRSAALADRVASAADRGVASIDELTGALTRGAGLAELIRDIARAHRTDQPLVLAFADVDRLKAVNDLHGHAAGDQLLREVANTLRMALRSYDPVIRYGGDEFVCVISGLSLHEASGRLAVVSAALAKGAEHGSVTIGLAELRPDDSAASLVARADAALYSERMCQRGGGEAE